MKTPEEFLREVIRYFPDDYVLDTPDEGISIHSIISAMEKYAIQSVECAKDSIEKIKEDEAWEKVHALEDDLHNSETENDSLKDNVKALTRANDRVEEELTTAIEIMEVIYNKADLNFDYKGHNMRETIKDYLGQ